MSKREIDTEQLVQWAYRDELPKRQISSAEGIWDRIETGRAGVTSDHHAAQRYAHFGLPHPDALVVEQTVVELPDIAIDWGIERIAPESITAAVERNSQSGLFSHAVIEKTNPRPSYSILVVSPDVSDVAALIDARDVLLLGSIRTAALVASHAKQGNRPDWRREPLRPMSVNPPRGRGPAIVGECRGKNTYTEGSYCPVRFDPSPVEIALERADYVAWRHGLMLLSQTLRLAEHVAIPPQCPEQPWRDGEDQHAVWSDKWAKQQQRLPLHPSRPHAGPVPKRRLGGVVRKISLDNAG